MTVWPRRSVWEKNRWIMCVLLNSVHSSSESTIHKIHSMSIQFHSISGHQRIVVFHWLVWLQSGEPCMRNNVNVNYVRAGRKFYIWQQQQKISAFFKTKFLRSHWNATDDVCAWPSLPATKVIFIFPFPQRPDNECEGKGEQRKREEEILWKRIVSIVVQFATQRVWNSLLLSGRLAGGEREREARTMEHEIKRMQWGHHVRCV